MKEPDGFYATLSGRQDYKRCVMSVLWYECGSLGFRRWQLAL